jgi:hypothetical protein
MALIASFVFQTTAIGRRGSPADWGFLDFLRTA